MAENMHALYRFFDGEGRLLYIGITADVPARFKKHRDEKPWWSDVARIAMEPFPDRQSVLAAERRAIKAEMPRWNIQHQNQPKPTSHTPAPRVPAAGKREIDISCQVCGSTMRKKGDGVVHVLMADIHANEKADADLALEMRTDPCPVCGKPSYFARTLDRFFHRDGSDNDPCWLAILRGDGYFSNLKVVPLSRYLDGPQEAKWGVHCDACNPHFDPETDTYCDGCYWFDVDHCRTQGHLLDWTAHLLEKDWIRHTNWSQFVRKFAGVDA